MNKRPVVFLDRDGTILNERGYLQDFKKMKFYSSSFKGLRRLQNHGFALVVVSNQSGVGRGYFTRASLDRLHHIFNLKLKKKGIKLSGIYYCPHKPMDNCACRKPKPGLVKRATRELNLDLRKAYVVGDQDRDMALAKAIHAKGVLVLTGAGRISSQAVQKWRPAITSNLDTASRWIIRDYFKKDDN